jgi:hypothetical protein
MKQEERAVVLSTLTSVVLELKEVVRAVEDRTAVRWKVEKVMQKLLALKDSIKAEGWQAADERKKAEKNGE